MLLSRKSINYYIIIMNSHAEYVIAICDLEQHFKFCVAVRGTDSAPQATLRRYICRHAGSAIEK